MVFILGLLLVAAAAGFTIDVFVQNATSMDVDVLGRTFVVTPGWLVIAGIGALVVFIVGARLVFIGVARARRRRTALRMGRNAAQERDRLAQQLAVERADREHPEPEGHATSRHDDTTTTPPEAISNQTGPRTGSAESLGGTDSAAN
jgi:hypothetical protein